MEQAHARSLAAIQPFMLQATSTKNASPRFLSDLIKRATEAPGTFVFTEFLQLPETQSLRSPDTPPEFQACLVLLEIFSWGTYAEYKQTPNLPELNHAQTHKLKQLSLLTLASPFVNTTPGDNALSYSALLQALSLPDAAALESLVTSCIYSGLLTARLSPTSDPPAVHIHTVAPLRDLRPQSLPTTLQILSTWSARCDSVIADLENHIENIRQDAQQRHALAEKRQGVIDTAVLSQVQSDDKKGGKGDRGRGNKRDFDNEEDDSDGEVMEVDDGYGEAIGSVGSSSSARGIKRGRGKG